MRALALGARSCMIGRAYAYGLGAGGEAGVAKALDILGKEMLTTMGLCGVNTIAEIDDNVLAVTIPAPQVTSARPANASSTFKGASAAHVLSIHEHPDACRADSRRTHSGASYDGPPRLPTRDTSDAHRRCRPSDPCFGALNG